MLVNWHSLSLPCIIYVVFYHPSVHLGVHTQRIVECVFLQQLTSTNINDCLLFARCYIKLARQNDKYDMIPAQRNLYSSEESREVKETFSLNSYWVPSMCQMLVGSRDTPMTETDKLSAVLELTSCWWEINNKENKQIMYYVYIILLEGSKFCREEK